MDARFDLYELPAGHEDRFLAKLDAATARKQRNRTMLRWTTAAAAAAAIVCLLVLPSRNRHFFGARTPEAVYCAYLEQVGSYYTQLSANGLADESEWDTALTALTGETVPLFDQLPEDMPARQKMRILKQYYGELLDAADLLKHEWNN